eukprot:7376135-Prymnesium_polylepis.1
MESDFNLEEGVGREPFIVGLTYSCMHVGTWMFYTHRLRHGPAAGNEQCRSFASGPWQRQTCPCAWSDRTRGISAVPLWYRGISRLLCVHVTYLAAHFCRPLGHRHPRPHHNPWPAALDHHAHGCGTAPRLLPHRLSRVL